MGCAYGLCGCVVCGLCVEIVCAVCGWVVCVWVVCVVCVGCVGGVCGLCVVCVWVVYGLCVWVVCMGCVWAVCVWAVCVWVVWGELCVMGESSQVQSRDLRGGRGCLALPRLLVAKLQHNHREMFCTTVSKNTPIIYDAA